jgi:hypothetical protein
MRVEFLGRGRRNGHYGFRVVDLSARDLEWMGLAVGTGTANAQLDMLTDLSFAAEWGVMEKIWPHVDKVHQLGGRCLVVMELSRFPLLRCYVDERDQREVHRERDEEGADPFLKAVVSAWLGYDPEREVPEVIVNPNVPNTALKTLERELWFTKNTSITEDAAGTRTPCSQARFKREEMKIKFLGTAEGGLYLFQVVDYASQDPKIAVAVAMGCPSLATNLLRELPFAAERRLMEEMWPRIDEVNLRGARCIAVMDVSDFPFIGCYVDERDQREVYPESEGRDAFYKDVVPTWLGYDPAREVPAILVNLNIISHAGLKIFRKDAFGL